MKIISQKFTVPSENHFSYTVNGSRLFTNRRSKALNPRNPYWISWSSSHFEVYTTLEKISKRFYWATCKQDVEHWCKSCITCIAKKGQSDKEYNEMKIYNSGVPFERICPFPKSILGNKYLLVITKRSV